MPNIVYVTLSYVSPLTNYTIKERFKYRYEPELSNKVINKKLKPETVESYVADTIYVGRSLKELYERFGNRAATLLDYHIVVQ